MGYLFPLKSSAAFHLLSALSCQLLSLFLPIFVYFYLYIFIFPLTHFPSGTGGRAGCTAAGEDDQWAVAAGIGERWDEDWGKVGQREKALCSPLRRSIHLNVCCTTLKSVSIRIVGPFGFVIFIYFLFCFLSIFNRCIFCHFKSFKNRNK